jgi:hypothetical protein
MRLKLLLALLFVSGGLLMAQDTIRTLVITEAKLDRAEQSYFEITNRGETALNLSDFEVGRIDPWSTPQGDGWPETPVWNDDNTIERMPDVVLQPGESYVIGVVNDYIEEAYAAQVKKFGYSPDWGGKYMTNPKMWDLIDLQVHKSESPTNDPTDSISSSDDPLKNFPYLMEVWSGRDVWYIRYHTEGWNVEGNDSAVIDQVAGTFDDASGNGTNPDGGYLSVAGIERATGTHYLMRRHDVKTGNTTFVQGSDYADSEWIPVPFMGNNQYNERWRGPFWTVGNHVNATLDETTLQAIAGSSITVDFAQGIISAPWGVRNNDSIMYEFEYVPGLAWHYDFAPVHEDSSFSSVRTGDTLTIYACGDQVTIKSFRIEVQDPTTDEARVVPKYHPTDEMTYVGVDQPLYEVSEGVPGMDTIREIPFACRIDTLQLYLEKAPNASWEIVWVDGNERTDLLDGDILRVTAEDGTTTKDYYLKLRKYRKARNADLACIRWPDIPAYYLGSYWDSDTIPGFNNGVFNYTLELPAGYTKIPGLVAKNEDDNARHTVQRAVSLKGSLEDRTIYFYSVAEDDTTRKTYKVAVKLPEAPEDLQPWAGDAFISQFIFRDCWANSFIEFVNPGTELMDMSNYMFVTTTEVDPADAIRASFEDGSFETEESYFNNRYNKYIFGRIWADTADWAANPGTVDPNPDNNVNTVVLPGDVFVIGDIASTGTPYGGDGYGEGNWPVEEEMDLNVGTAGQYPCPWESVPNGGTMLDTWYNWKWMLYKIVGQGGDSVKAGLKPATDPNDFELIDNFGVSTNDQFYVGGKLIDQINGYTRHPEIYKGNPIYGDMEGSSFGDDGGQSATNCEWDIVDRAYFDALGYGWAFDILKVCDGIGAHFMNPVTVGISTVASYKLKVSTGFSMEETIKGAKAGLTVDGFLEKIVKKHEDQTLTVTSGGSEITGTTELTDGDILTVLSADQSNTTQYTIEVTAEGSLSHDALLTSATLTIGTDPATVGGFEIGTTVAQVVAAVTVPAGADMDIINAADAYVPTKTINFDTIAVDVLATSNVYFEVMAEDGETVITYQLMPDGNASDAYVTSTVFTVNQEDLLISLIPDNTSVRSFLENLVPATGATMVLYDKLGYERSTGVVSADDRLVVTAADGETTNIYYLSMLEGVPNYLAYVVSNVYVVDQSAQTISGTGVTGAVAVSDFMGNLIPATGASIEVQDNLGSVKDGASLLTDEDLLHVLAANGVHYMDYSIILDHTGINEANSEGVRIFPNPNRGQFYVEGAVAGSRIRVYNATGSSVIDITVTSGTEMISLEGQPNGLYIVAFGNATDVAGTFKVIKQ